MLGILSIVFASLALMSTVSSLCSKDDVGEMVSEILGKAPPSFEWKKDLAPVYTRLAKANLFGGVAYLAMSSVLLFLGINLVRCVSWARMPTIIWAATALVLSVVLAVVQAKIQAPAFSHIIAYARNTMPTGLPVQQDLFLGAMDSFMRYWWITFVFNVAYPAVLLILMARRSVKSAMAACDR